MDCTVGMKIIFQFDTHDKDPFSIEIRWVVFSNSLFYRMCRFANGIHQKYKFHLFFNNNLLDYIKSTIVKTNITQICLKCLIWIKKKRTKFQWSLNEFYVQWENEFLLQVGRKNFSLIWWYESNLYEEHFYHKIFSDILLQCHQLFQFQLTNCRLWI